MGGDEPVVTAVAATQARKAVGQDAVFEKGVERVLHELRQVRACLGLSLREEGRDVLLHQALQRGPFREVALVANGCVKQRPLALLADGLHARLPK